MSESESGTDRFRWWIEVLTTTGILVGLLYYFGYVTTDAWFRYFGLELSQVQLSQQAIVLQSIAALYLPLGALLALGLGVYFARRGIDTLLAAGWRPRVVRVGGIVAIVLGVVLVGRALAGVFVPEVSRTEQIATSPLSLCLGVMLLAGGINVVRRVGRPDLVNDREPDRSVGPTLMVGALVVLGLFWATNSVAGAYGRGRAVAFAQSLAARPAVVLDTKERLFLMDDRVEESALTEENDAEYRFRYRNLRLLAASNGSLYLAPKTWRRGEGTVVVLPEDGVRLQFLR